MERIQSDVSEISSSVMGWTERGPYGQSSYRGNTSGYLIEALIRHYGVRSVLDPFSGGGTTKDVCRKLNVPMDAFDLKDGFDVATSPLPPKKYDLIFLHPPYWFMIQYSNDSRDLSNAPSIGSFNTRLGSIILRLSEYLSERGKIVVLIGNLRKSGQYYPLGSYLEVLFRENLKEELIKVQYNTSTETKQYANNNFIRIMHEKVLVFADFKPVTWRDLVLRALNELGGIATNGEIYDALNAHPKTLTNPTFRDTIRRTLQEVARNVSPGKWSVGSRA